ncbi:hypothetical protein O4H49_20130 [Kiloniella laminariae]|uniref:Uncharacterized protein n=1 Tax=Kiloniella laminariae TaxID=454162 RepID=A0ABT4LPP7_9PROT|nr:hypothetical protein [Kiloniella laminariae]MCZ4283104.1 hypothetical protein [Kiloniella laminariae]
MKIKLLTSFITTYYFLAISNLANAQLAIPDNIDTNQDPVEKFKEFLTYVFDGLVTVGAGIAGCALLYIVVTAISGGRPNVRWGAIAIGGGIFITSLGFILDKIFSS